MLKFVVFSFLIVSASLAKDTQYTFDTKYIDIPLDHFSFTSNRTFTLRYLVNDTYFAEDGAIFFYDGNEGDISMFAQNSGLLFDMAPSFKALIVFAEHRYYGESLPFGNLSYTAPEYLGYLSSMQAMADFVFLINDLQKNYANPEVLEKLPVIAFGGSYGGMLAAWQKMKYPNSILGAIASSAPIWQFKGQNPCDSFYKIITDDFQTIGGDKCATTIKNSWEIIRTLAKNDSGKAELAKFWNFCTAFETDNDIDALVDWVSEVYAALAETNYPYPTNFLAPLPGNPIKEFCSKIDAYEYDDDKGLLKSIGEALQIYTNYTGTTKCNSLQSTSDVLGEDGWNFQACTEMIMPLCSKDDDMFENIEWDFQKYSDNCYKQFGIRPVNDEVPILLYGGKDLSAAHNIIFTNGLMDPWSGYGVLTNYSSDVLAMIIKDGVHHSDLRGGK
ncbi:hypothetical protein NQ318_008588 [Aromia moschata]|uniref:Lysosomal Pro-X carboxypeptidase n=1 Tax=Aromia moschata TaxID=1265417 RepID=A0AAV8YWI6_9CUCU|nr:hypothetical protein NQ318_008588 [Aromia moschata]